MTADVRDALVVGGGLAGGMAALQLARAGRRTVLLERSSGAHDKVCGEFISAEAIRYVTAQGIDLPALGAVPLRSVRLATRSGAVEQALPFAAYSLTRRVLDEEVLRLACASGAEVRRGANAVSLDRNHEAWHATLGDGSAISARHAFLATGKHDLRGRPRPAGSHADLIGFKMYYQLAPAQHQSLGQAVELALFTGGYAGLQPVQDEAANLCLLVRASRFRALGSSWTHLLEHLLSSSSHLAQRLGGAVPLLEKPLAAFNIPYGHLQHTAEHNLWHVGDQAAVIPSFSGDGMAIALHSSAMAVKSVLLGESTLGYQARLSLQLGARLQYATLLSKLMVGFPYAAQLVQIFPGLLRHIGTLTRIPEGALLA